MLIQIPAALQSRFPTTHAFLGSEIRHLHQICKFVRQHSPGETAEVDAEAGVVRWDDGYEMVSAATMKEARDLLGY